MATDAGKRLDLAVKRKQKRKVRKLVAHAVRGESGYSPLAPSVRKIIKKKKGWWASLFDKV